MVVLNVKVKTGKKTIYPSILVLLLNHYRNSVHDMFEGEVNPVVKFKS